MSQPQIPTKLSILNSYSYRECQQLCKQIGCKAVGTKNELVERCKDKLNLQEEELNEVTLKLSTLCVSKKVERLKDTPMEPPKEPKEPKVEKQKTLFDYGTMINKTNKFIYDYIDPSNVKVEEIEFDILYDLGVALKEPVLKKQKQADFKPIVEKMNKEFPLKKNKTKSEDRYIELSKGIITLFIEQIDAYKEKETPEETITSLLEGGLESRDNAKKRKRE